MLKRDMTDEARRRLYRYEAKLDPKIIAKRFACQKKQMVANMAKYQEEIYPIEEKIRAIIREENVPKILIIYYFAYAHEVFRISRRHTSKTKENEVTLIFEKWRARGLKEEVLERIKKEILNDRIE